MPDEDPTPTETTETIEQTAETPAEGVEESTETEVTTETETVTEETPPAGADWSMDTLPASAAKYIRDLRAENANHRTRATSAEQALAEAKPEELAATVAQVTADNARLARELLVTRVASQFELPAELADVLKGDDEAALTEHAKTLAKYAGLNDEPDNLSGGLTPNTGEEYDPVKAARAARRSRR